MKRATEERGRAVRVWRRHLRLFGDAHAAACSCEQQPGRFRKARRVGGCSNPRCYLCHSAKLLGEPTLQQRRSAISLREWVAPDRSRESEKLVNPPLEPTTSLLLNEPSYRSGSAASR
jgi:hypothetical protein